MTPTQQKALEAVTVAANLARLLGANGRDIARAAGLSLTEAPHRVPNPAPIPDWRGQLGEETPNVDLTLPGSIPGLRDLAVESLGFDPWDIHNDHGEHSWTWRAGEYNAFGEPGPEIVPLSTAVGRALAAWWVQERVSLLEMSAGDHFARTDAEAVQQCMSGDVKPKHPRRLRMLVLRIALEQHPDHPSAPDWRAAMETP